MTKEIIIDGIDCSWFEDCVYYKQLKYLEKELQNYKTIKIEMPYDLKIKRLEQENEKLKKQLEIDKNQINYFIEENEKLKEEIKNMRINIFKEPIMTKGECEQIIEEIKYKQEMKLLKENSKYYYLLEKIKEMCENAISECSCKNPNKDVDCFECTSGGRAELGKEILDKINEVLK